MRVKKFSVCFIAGALIAVAAPITDSMAAVHKWEYVDNAWRCIKENGETPYNEWICMSGSWYHFDRYGRMQTGWLEDAGRWYYLDPSSGIMLSSTTRTIRGTDYTFDTSGVLVIEGQAADSSRPGSWSGRTFTNSWSGYSLTLPMGYRLNERYDSRFDGYVKDFSALSFDGDVAFQCVYKNMGQPVNDAVLEQYMDEMETGYAGKAGERGSVVFGDHEFSYFRKNADHDTALDVYFRKMQNHIMVIQVQYRVKEREKVNMILYGMENS